jgi:hypothetical protein
MGAAVVLLGGMGSASLAHAIVVSDDLGHDPDNVDVWRLECPALTVKVQANVHDNADPDTVILGVAVVRPIASAPEKLKADFRVAPDGPGPSSKFAGDVPTVAGPKAYFVLVVKDKASNPAGTLEAYSSHMECRDVNGIEIGTVDPTLVQDQ